jgi:hypothetical protein
MSLSNRKTPAARPAPFPPGGLRYKDKLKHALACLL